MYHISDSLDIEAYRAAFARDSFVQVPEFLESKSAENLFQLIRSQPEWNLAFNKLGEHVDLSFRDYSNWAEPQKNSLNEIVWSQAESEFQYLYKSIPVYDIYTNNLLPGNELNKIYDLVNSSAFIDLMRRIVGDDSISFADAQVTSFDKGHFLKEHDDNVQGKNRVAAYVLNLTPDWHADWGGLFHLFDEEGAIARSVIPGYNVINVFRVPRKHSVSYVTPFARGSRLSITGWLRRRSAG